MQTRRVSRGGRARRPRARRRWGRSRRARGRPRPGTAGATSATRSTRREGATLAASRSHSTQPSECATTTRSSSWRAARRPSSERKAMPQRSGHGSSQAGSSGYWTWCPAARNRPASQVCQCSGPEPCQPCRMRKRTRLSYVPCSASARCGASPARSAATSPPPTIATPRRAASRSVEILASWPGVHALLAHRVAHALHHAGVPFVPACDEHGDASGDRDRDPSGRADRRRPVHRPRHRASSSARPPRSATTSRSTRA